MDDPVSAVVSLRASADVERRETRTELPPDEWPSESIDTWVGVGAVVLSPARDRVALVRNWWSGDRWVFPGGGVEPSDESLRAALRREVREETGLPITIERPVLVEDQTYVHSVAPERSFDGWFVLFQTVAEETTFSDAPGEDPDEIEAVRWFESPPETLLSHAEFVRAVLEES